jgi:hypothetical protein
VLLLPSGKVQHFVGVFDQDGALRFGLGDIDGICEDCDFSFRHFFYIACRKSSGIGSCYWEVEVSHTFGFPAKYHTLHDSASCQTTSHNFDNPHIVYIE